MDGQRYKYEASYAACVDWDAEQQVLYVGDERGQVCAWNLSQALATLDDPSVKPGNFHGDAATNARAADIHLPSMYEGWKLVSLDWVIKAHDDSVTSLTAATEPRCLVTSSYDKCVHAWSRRGKRLGLLVRCGRGDWHHYLLCSDV